VYIARQILFRFIMCYDADYRSLVGNGFYGRTGSLTCVLVRTTFHDFIFMRMSAQNVLFNTA